MKVLGIIPARYYSTRLEGKPLLDICGKPMIQWVYEQTKKAIEEVIVATDDQRIYDVVKNFGGIAIMTADQHPSGTDRCLEAYEKYLCQYDLADYDVIINIQGDEPLISTQTVYQLIQCFKDPSVNIATLVTEVTNQSDLNNEGEVFVTFNRYQNALYFSRAVIPHIRGIEKEKWLQHHTYYKHLGLYGFTPSSLKKIVKLKQSQLEITEALEQNRWLENGEVIKVAITEEQSIPVDTLDDLKRVRKIIQHQLNDFN